LKKNRPDARSILLVLMVSLFFVSISMFVFQVLLTRIFSPMLRYHYVFMLTAMAIFGLGIGGMISYRLGKKNSNDRIISLLPGWLLLLSASYIGVFSLIYKLPFINQFVFYSILATIPYILGGIFISLLFKAMPASSHKLYFADLFGAGIGSLGVVFFINRLGIVNTILLISGLALFSAFILSFKIKDNKNRFAAVILITILVIGAFNQNWVERFESGFKGYYTSPMTSLARLRSNDTEHFLEDRHWDAYSRADVIGFPHENNMKLISIDGGANSQMLRFDGDLANMGYLQNEINYLPFEAGKNEKALLIGPGGGKDVVLALIAGSRDIDAVEISGSTVEIVNRYAAYNGDIYNRDGVNLFVQDGRNFVKHTEKKYDIIYLAQVMTEVAETVGYALAENFIYTEEAISDYWGVLEDEGRISFILHDDQDLRKMILTVYESLKGLGIEKSQIFDHMIIAAPDSWGHGHDGEIMMPMLMVKKTPFTYTEVEGISKAVDNNLHIPIHLPYANQNEMFQQISMGAIDINDLYFEDNLNFSPTRDNRPFFFDFNRGVDFSLIGLLAAVFIGFLFFKPSLRKNKMKRSPYYFIGLGIGFMLIEIPLIQLVSLILGHPTTSFIVTLIALLLGGGLGSLFGGWKKFKWKGRYLPLLGVTIWTIIAYLLLNTLMYQWNIPSLGSKITIIVSLLFPLGFFMGMPFPFGIKRMKEANKERAIPLAWGINGIMSVGGSVLAIIIAMKLGFSYTLAAGALVYLLLFIIMPLYSKKEDS